MTTCKHCANTIWTKELQYGEWVMMCSNCSHTRKLIKRTPKGVYMTTGQWCGDTVYLTSYGWKTFKELKNPSDACYTRKSKNILYWLNVEYVSNIETTFHENKYR